MRGAVFLLSAAAVALSGCVTAPQGLMPVSVTASGETEPVGTVDQDAADDPAIWRNPADPAKSLIVATDKRAGLHVYDLAGRTLFSDSSGRLNNVDLATLPDGRVIVAASDRNDPATAMIQVWQLDTATGALAPLGTSPGGSGEGYGFCMRQVNGVLHAYSVLKDGTIEEYAIRLTPALTSQHLRTRKVATQAEGCVVDPRSGTLYVGEETAGIWRFGAEQTEGALVAAIDNRYLVADVEGLALAPEGTDGGYLVASSQGDNAYAVFRLPDVVPVGRFRIAEGAFGSTEETDGIELVTGSFGAAYPEGLFVAQDGKNAPAAQNFKLVSWGTIIQALGL